jgi:hypothetical protein
VLQAAGDALLAVTAKLDTYAGRSRFTTWAVKFVLLATSMRLRRHAWRGRPVSSTTLRGHALTDTTTTSAQRHVEQLELLEDLRRAVGAALTNASARSSSAQPSRDPHRCPGRAPGLASQRDAAFTVMDEYAELLGGRRRRPRPFPDVAHPRAQTAPRARGPRGPRHRGRSTRLSGRSRLDHPRILPA